VTAAGRATGALERTRELLSPAEAERASERGLNEAGYLDLLDTELESTGVTQDLMVTRLVPAIYERYWRPALGRLAKGVTGPGMAEEIRIARLLLGLGEGDVVLDVACGPGNFSREFARAVGPDGLVAGIDASRTMLERGGEDLRRSELGNLVLIRGDATRLPFREATFDAACCFAALHLFPDPFAALDEMTRVLCPGGRIALMTSVRRELTVRPLKPVLERASGMRIFEGEEIVAALEERGFTGIHRRLSGMVQFVGGRLPAEG
jgi:ubiquinone/menaquinone biosynthesis C-methylase UbiE